MIPGTRSEHSSDPDMRQGYNTSARRSKSASVNECHQDKFLMINSPASASWLAKGFSSQLFEQKNDFNWLLSFYHTIIGKLEPMMLDRNVQICRLDDGVGLCR